MNSQKAMVPTRRYLVGGLVAGVVGAIFAIMVAQGIEAVTGRHYSQLSPISIVLASLITNIIGAWVFSVMERRMNHPLRAFAGVATVMATLDTINVSVHPPASGFGAVADPLHYIVAAAAITIMPVVVNRYRSSQAVIH